MKTTNATKRNRPAIHLTVSKEIAAWIRNGAKASHNTVSKFVEINLRAAYEARHSDKKRSL